jgi:NTP pyrophosphatase (non-canonical NTP hydrolase)
MSDSINELTAEICAFRDARDWAQFHNQKEMAVAIAAEAGELLQHFVWQDAGQSLERISARRAEIESEMADVAILLFEMAANCEVDLAAAMRAKLEWSHLTSHDSTLRLYQQARPSACGDLVV